MSPCSLSKVNHVIVAATHRQPSFIAASQSVSSRLTSFLVAGLRRDIVTAQAMPDFGRKTPFSAAAIRPLPSCCR